MLHFDIKLNVIMIVFSIFARREVPLSLVTNIMNEMGLYVIGNNMFIAKKYLLRYLINH